MPVAFFSAVLAAVGLRGFAPVRFSGLAITYITYYFPDIIDVPLIIKIVFLLLEVRYKCPVTPVSIG